MAMGLLARAAAVLVLTPAVGAAAVWLTFAAWGGLFWLPVVYGCAAGAWIAVGRGRSEGDVAAGLAIGLAAIVLGFAVAIPIAISAVGE